MEERALKDGAKQEEEQKHEDDHGGMFEQLKEAVTDAVEDAVEAVQDAVEHAVEVVEEQVDHVKDHMQTVAERAFGQLQSFNMVSAEFAKVIDTWLKDRIRGQLEQVLDRLPAIIKGVLNNDPDMIQKVWHYQCRWIDSSWPDIRRELMTDLCVMLAVHPPPSKLKDPDEPGPDCFRRFWRYHLFPYNKSFWGRLHHPLWLLFVLLQFNPVSAISAVAFLFVFLIIDRADEYQLIQFILLNKGAQFIAHALMRTFVGYFMYVDCVLSIADGEFHDCSGSGPGMTGPTWLIMGGWLFQVSLVWLALVLIPCTREHIGVNQAFDDPELPPELVGVTVEGEGEGGGALAQAGELGEGEVPAPGRTHSFASEKSGVSKMFDHYHDRAKSVLLALRDEDKRHLRRLMLYDFFCLLLIGVILVAFIIPQGSPDSVVVRQVLLACQVLYGYLSLPFFIFSLPVVQKSMFHVRRTAYDELGRTRFYRGAEKPPRQQPDFPFANLQLVDTDKLLGKIMNAFAGDWDGSIYHTFETTTLMMPASCGHCHGKLKGMRSKAMKCTACGEKWCEECSKKFEEPCETKAKQKENEEREEREEADAKKAAASTEIQPEEVEEDDGTDMKQRFKMFSQYWRVSGEVLKALSSIDGLASAANPEKFTEVIRVWLKKQSHGYVENLVDRIPGILKWMWEEPDMPPILKKGKDKFLDTVWDEIEEEILYNFKVILDGERYVAEDDDDTQGVDCFRAKIRHSLLPYDRTIWWQIQDPFFIILSVLPLIPWAAIVPLVFFFIFIVIDKTDEFQLVEFILRFKGMQFLSHGLIKNIIGFYTYFNCTNDFKEGLKGPEDEGRPPTAHTCEINGPGMSKGMPWMFETMLGGWLLMIVLTYAAFCLLPCSKEKGRRQLNSEDLADAGGEAHEIAAGGKLRHLVIYDFFCFGICFGVLLYVWHLQRWETNWVVIQTLFACQIVYGYLAIPFFFFNLPVAKTILSHSVRTGYDVRGRVRAFEGPPKKDPEVLAEQYKALERIQREKEGLPPLEEEDETGGLLDRIRSIFSGLFGLDLGGDKSGEEEGEAADKEPRAESPAAGGGEVSAAGGEEKAAVEADGVALSGRKPKECC